MSSKEQKKLYKDKNIRNRKERNDKRTIKNSIYCEDPFLTEGDYDKNINNIKKEVIIDNQNLSQDPTILCKSNSITSLTSLHVRNLSHIKNELELETINKKSKESFVNNEEIIGVFRKFQTPEAPHPGQALLGATEEEFDDSYFEPNVYK